MSRQSTRSGIRKEYGSRFGRVVENEYSKGRCQRHLRTNSNSKPRNRGQRQYPEGEYMSGPDIFVPWDYPSRLEGIRLSAAQGPFDTRKVIPDERLSKTCRQRHTTTIPHLPLTGDTERRWTDPRTPYRVRDILSESGHKRGNNTCCRNTLLRGLNRTSRSTYQKQTEQGGSQFGHPVFRLHNPMLLQNQRDPEMRHGSHFQKNKHTKNGNLSRESTQWKNSLFLKADVVATSTMPHTKNPTINQGALQEYRGTHTHKITPDD